jgi:hypothetical protein
MQLTNGKAATLLLATLLLAGCGSNEQSSRWAGKTFLLDIPANHWIKPTRDVGGEIAPFVPQFLLGITGSASSLTVTVATATGGVQDKCNRTQQTTLSESDYPNSQIVLGSFPLTFKETNETVTPSETITVASTLHNLTFANVLPGDAAATEGTLTVTSDIDELYKLFIKIEPQPPTVENVCGALNTAGSACEACAFDSTKKHCLTLGAVQLGAKSVNTSVEQISVGNSAGNCH